MATAKKRARQQIQRVGAYDRRWPPRLNPGYVPRVLGGEEQATAILAAEYDVRCATEALRCAQDRLEWAKRGFEEPPPEAYAEPGMVIAETTETVTEELANPRRRRNPTPDYKAAHWGREAPNGVQSASAGDPSKGPLVAYGELRSVTYSTRKGKDRELVDYVHAFRKERPVLAFNREGKGRLIVVGGSYTCEARGIVG